MIRPFLARGAVLAAALVSSTLSAVSPATRVPPRLTVVVVADQMRGDYLARFDGDGGIRRLRGWGFTYLDAHQSHVPTETGPGHAVLLTGAPPAVSGIPGNTFLAFDPARREGERVHCVQDPAYPMVGAHGPPSRGASPRFLRVTTVADELERMTRGASKTVSLAFKDRAAILMAGHLADLALWYDVPSGRWVTSRFYATSLPDWVEALDAGRVTVEARRGRRTIPSIADRIAGDGAFPDVKSFVRSGRSNAYLLESAMAAVTALELGKDDVPDLLMLGLSGNDWVGHLHGPESDEVRTAFRQLDAALDEFLAFLDDRVGRDRYVVALTADHGVAAVPGGSIPGAVREGTTSGRLDPALVATVVDGALDERFGDASWVLAFDQTSLEECRADGSRCETEPNLYLDRRAILEKRLEASVVERAAADAAMTVPGVYLAVTRSQVLDGRLPASPIAPLVANGYDPRNGGDVVVLRQAGWWLPIEGDPKKAYRTGHGGPWAQESHVALVLAGPGIRRGASAERVSLTDLAPTLSILLGTPYPTGCQGKPLASALRLGGR